MNKFKVGDIVRVKPIEGYQKKTGRVSQVLPTDGFFFYKIEGTTLIFREGWLDTGEKKNKELSFEV